MTKVLDSRAGGHAVGWGVCCPHPWCHQTLLVCRDPVMSQVKGHVAPTGWWWLCDAISGMSGFGLLPATGRNSDSWGRADPA